MGSPPVRSYTDDLVHPLEVAIVACHYQALGRRSCTDKKVGDVAALFNQPPEVAKRLGGVPRVHRERLDAVFAKPRRSPRPFPLRDAAQKFVEVHDRRVSPTRRDAEQPWVRRTVARRLQLHNRAIIQKILVPMFSDVLEADLRSIVLLAIRSLDPSVCHVGEAILAQL